MAKRKPDVNLASGFLPALPHDECAWDVGVGMGTGMMLTMAALIAATADTASAVVVAV